MRRLLGRWVAILALVAGVAVAASAVPASADPAVTSSTPLVTVHPRMQPNTDWWY